MKAIQRTAEDLQSSLDALLAAHGEAQEILLEEVDRAASLNGLIAQVRAMAERWVVSGCHTDTAKDLVQLILAAIVSQAPGTATLLSESQELIGFIPESYKTILSSKPGDRLSLEEAQEIALREILNQRNICTFPHPGGVQ